MTGPAGILPLDVAVCDDDLLWRVEHMNALHSLNVRDFSSITEAVDALTPGHDSVVLVGPTEVEEALNHVPSLVAEHPEWPLLFVLERDDPSLVARVDAAGAATVLDLHAIPHLVEVSVTALLSKREFVSAQEEEDEWRVEGDDVATLPMGEIVVVTSAKGGEGVTLVALNLAAALAEGRQDEVAYVEGDAEFGDVSLLLRLPGRPHVTFDRLLFDGESIDRLSVFHDETGFRIVRPPMDPSTSHVPPRVARRLVEGVARQCDIVVVDAPFDLVRSSGIASRASAVLLVTSARTPNIKNAIVAIHELGPLTTVHLVVNNAGRHRVRTDARKVAQASHEDVIAVIPYDTKVEDSMRTLAPPGLLPPRSHFRQACNDLAAHLRADVFRTASSPETIDPDA